MYKVAGWVNQKHILRHQIVYMYERHHKNMCTSENQFSHTYLWLGDSVLLKLCQSFETANESITYTMV